MRFFAHIKCISFHKFHTRCLFFCSVGFLSRSDLVYLSFGLSTILYSFPFSIYLSHIWLTLRIKVAAARALTRSIHQSIYWSIFAMLLPFWMCVFNAIASKNRPITQYMQIEAKRKRAKNIEKIYRHQHTNKKAYIWFVYMDACCKTVWTEYPNFVEQKRPMSKCQNERNRKRRTSKTERLRKFRVFFTFFWGM